MFSYLFKIKAVFNENNLGEYNFNIVKGFDEYVDNNIIVEYSKINVGKNNTYIHLFFDVIKFLDEYFVEYPEDYEVFKQIDIVRDRFSHLGTYGFFDTVNENLHPLYIEPMTINVCTFLKNKYPELYIHHVADLNYTDILIIYLSSERDDYKHVFDEYRFDDVEDLDHIKDHTVLDYGYGYYNLYFDIIKFLEEYLEEYPEDYTYFKSIDVVKERFSHSHEYGFFDTEK